jgi:hypothetical protein
MADIFKLFSGHNDVLPSLTIIAKGRPMRETDSEEIKNLYIEQLVSMLHLAGVKDLKKAYEELDAIALEHGVSGMGEAEIKEVTL